MAVFGRINQTTLKPQSATLETSNVTFDAVLQEKSDYSVVVTEHPIEDGSEITDHVRDEADKFELEGIISRTPVENPVKLVLESSTRHEDAWQQLYSWLRGHTLLKAITPIGTQENVVIINLSRRRTKDTGESATVNVKLKKITTAVSSEAEAPSRPSTQKPRSNKGVATAKETTPAVQNGILAQAIWGG